MVSRHVTDFAHLCTDPETIRRTQEAMYAYRNPANVRSAQPGFREAVRTFRLPETPRLLRRRVGNSVKAPLCRYKTL